MNPEPATVETADGPKTGVFCTLKRTGRRVFIAINSVLQTVVVYPLSCVWGAVKSVVKWVWTGVTTVLSFAGNCLKWIAEYALKFCRKIKEKVLKISRSVLERCASLTGIYTVTVEKKARE